MGEEALPGCLGTIFPDLAMVSATQEKTRNRRCQIHRFKIVYNHYGLNRPFPSPFKKIRFQGRQAVPGFDVYICSLLKLVSSNMGKITFQYRVEQPFLYEALKFNFPLYWQISRADPVCIMLPWRLIWIATYCLLSPHGLFLLSY